MWERLTKAIQIKAFRGSGNVSQQGDLETLFKIKFPPPPSSLNLMTLSLLHISVCSVSYPFFPFPLSFLTFLSAFLGFLLQTFPPVLLFFSSSPQQRSLLYLAQAPCWCMACQWQTTRRCTPRHRAPQGVSVFTGHCGQQHHSAAQFKRETVIQAVTDVIFISLTTSS